MKGGYKAVATSDGRAFVRDGSERSLMDADAAAFDCDGVLIDAKDSYDATTAKATELLIEEILGVNLPLRSKIPTLIHTLRKTGGFNNEWDTTYALTAFAVLSHASRTSRESSSDVANRVSSLADSFARSASADGQESVDLFVADTLPSESLRILRRAKAYMEYPGVPPDSYLSTLYDEMYHGDSLFKKLYGFEATYYRDRGLIENERLLVGNHDLRALSVQFEDKIAIDTGRPRIAAEYTLGRLLSFFDSDASLFLGDHDRDQGAKFIKKPSPVSLVHIKGRLGSSTLLYIGDSAEDLLMAQQARVQSGGFVFAGVYGSSYDPADQIQFFRRKGADIVVPSARSLPEAYRRIGSG